MLSRRQIGKRALSLPVLGFGASSLFTLPRGEAIATVQAALAVGMDHVDTAPFYGLGESERCVGQALAPIQAPFTLSTKVGRLIRSGSKGEPKAVFDYSADGVHRSLEESLTRLDRSQIDLLILHDVSQRFHGERTDKVFDEALAGAYRAMLRWREQGVIKAIGVGVNDCAICMRALAEADFDFLLLAGRITLLDQEGFEKVLPDAQARGVGVIAAAPFNSGILATGARSGATYFYQAPPAEILDRTRRIEAVCTEYAVPLRAAALQLPLRHCAVSCVLAGYRSVDEVADNAALLSVAIPAAFWEELRKRGLLSASVP